MKNCFEILSVNQNYYSLSSLCELIFFSRKFRHSVAKLAWSDAFLLFEVFFLYVDAFYLCGEPMLPQWFIFVNGIICKMEMNVNRNFIELSYKFNPK